MPRLVRLGLGRAVVEREVDDELAFHLEQRTQQLVAGGASPDEAHREALRQFGNLQDVRRSLIKVDRERARAMKRATFFDNLRQDMVYGLRMLRRNAGVSAVVVLTLALGIGANTAIFTLVNAVLLRKLPVRSPDDLVTIGNPTRVGGMSFSTSPRTDLYSYKTYTDLRVRDHLSSGVLASGRVDRLDIFLDRPTGEPSHARGRLVSGNYFSVLGVPALYGRTFDGSEDKTVGGAPVVTVSYSYWTRRLASDRRAVGREVLINGSRFTIIGVTPPWFTGEIVGQSIDVWLPLSMQPVLSPNRTLLEDPQAYWLLLLARRAPGVTFEQAQSGFTTLVRQILMEQAPSPTVAKLVGDLPIQVSSGAKGFSRVRGSYKAPLVTLMVGVGLLLLIMCANVATLLLGRAVARGKEMSVRLAIGAGRARLVAQLLTESLLLALLGGAAGLIVARWGSALLLALVADGGTKMPIDVRQDVLVLSFTAGLSIVAVVLFGLLPALRGSRVDLASTMRASAKGLTGGGLGRQGQRIPLGKLLIAAQVALSMVLLLGSALLVRSLWSVQNTSTGLDRDHLLIVDLDANARGITGARLTPFVQEMNERLQRVAGVSAVSYSENGIFSGSESSTDVAPPSGFTARVASDSISAYDEIGPGYVHAIGGRVLQGRDLAASDGERDAPVVLVNESFVRFYFGETSALGASIRVGDSTHAQIVGVIRDVRDHALVGAPERRFYVSYVQHPFGEPGSIRFIVRASGDPALLAKAIRQAVAAYDPQLPIASVDPLSALMRQSISEERVLAKLATGFGVVALLLAAVGLYGVMTYAITRRTGEIGLRVALGAQRRNVVGMILGDAMRMVFLGVVVGVPLALAATKLLRTQLHGVTPADPAALSMALVVLGGSGIIAALLPALRASRVTPVEALREE